jgi:D-serine deaminase-like pyridoxal phosphate-dependent protein
VTFPEAGGARASAALHDVALPAMVLKESALENNLAVMARYSAENGFLLAPHGKTTMAPELFRRQLAAGAWGITVANTDQAAVAFRSGAARVLVANQIVGRAAARAVVDQLEAGGRELYCLVDSVPGVELLSDNLERAGLRGHLGVFIELGVPGGRTGVRTPEQAPAIAQAVSASSQLLLVGTEGFEGLLAADRSPAALERVDRYLDDLRSLTVLLAQEHAFPGPGPVLVSAGGSRYFDRVVQVLGRSARYEGVEVRLVVRSGCYLVHDHGTYAAASPLVAGAWAGGSLLPALEVWAEVLSVPEAGHVIVGMGKRDVPYDIGLPVPLHIVRGHGGHLEPFAGGDLTRLDDQHGYLHLGPGQAAVAPGDRIGFGISHPCTAFDKWREVLLVNDDYEVLDHIPTFFH